MLTGIIPQAVEKTKKYGFVHRSSKYKLIGDVLYMQGADLVLRRVPWKEGLEKVLKENHEGACGEHFCIEDHLTQELARRLCVAKCTKICKSLV